MFQTVLLEVVEGMRSRPYQAHLSFKYIPKLWQLVQAKLPQELPDLRNPRVILDLEKGPLAFIPVTAACSERLKIFRG